MLYFKTYDGLNVLLVLFFLLVVCLLGFVLLFVGVSLFIEILRVHLQVLVQNVPYLQFYVLFNQFCDWIMLLLFILFLWLFYLCLSLLCLLYHVLSINPSLWRVFPRCLLLLILVVIRSPSSRTFLLNLLLLMGSVTLFLPLFSRGQCLLFLQFSALLFTFILSREGISQIIKVQWWD